MRRIVALLSYVFRSRFERELVSRRQLDDQAFYDAHFGGNGMPKDIPLRVCKVCVEQLGDCWKGVGPDDSLCESDPDRDLAELFYEIEDEFRIKIPDEEMKRMDGSVDAIVRYVASGRHSLS
jgi:acyl carrier protein